ncbi:MAG: hypothetical protein ABII00_14985 [Elusimicrobiota bacterium]
MSRPGLLAALILVPFGCLAAAEALREAELKARQATADFRESGRERYRTLQRLKKDLRYNAEVLDRDTLEESRKDLEAYARGGLARIEAMRRRGNIEPKLLPTLDRIERLYRELPGKRYAEPYAQSLVMAIAHELRWISENAADEGRLFGALGDHLRLPEAVDEPGFLKKGVSVEDFIAQGPIKVFLAKHRLELPKTYVKTTAADIVAGEHPVQAGVEVEGTVTRHIRFSIDGDYAFDVGDLHVEITPEWRLMHRGIPRPKTGDRVRVRGWSYFDSFHKQEPEYDPEDPVLGANRYTKWEIHPAMEIELLPAEQPSR